MQHIRRHSTVELMQPSRHSQQDTLHRTHDQARHRSGASHYSGLTRANLHQDCARHRNAPTENTKRDSRTLLRGSVHFRRDTEPRLAHDTITPPTTTTRRDAHNQRTSPPCSTKHRAQPTKAQPARRLTATYAATCLAFGRVLYATAPTMHAPREDYSATRTSFTQPSKLAPQSTRTAYAPY